MKASLKLECVGDYLTHSFELNKRITAEVLTPGIAEAVFGKIPSRFFVAEITGFDPKYQYTRRFLPCKKDYKDASSNGNRRIYAYYLLDDGKIYDVLEPVSWKKSRRYFCTITTDGDFKILTKQEVDQCLRSRSE